MNILGIMFALAAGVFFGIIGPVTKTAYNLGAGVGLAIFLRYIDLQDFSLIFFGISVALMIISILLYVVETQQSHSALSNHINELKSIEK